MNSINFRAWHPEKQKMYEVAKIDMWGDPDQATCDLAAIDEEYLHEGYVCLAVSPIAKPKEEPHETD